ncbi:MAG: hypothetical protein SO373_02055, partial [Candidatus Borkfalkiaceae bacterium]|nr:hypothetical protein [Christensenellaceae bacterium]
NADTIPKSLKISKKKHQLENVAAAVKLFYIWLHPKFLNRVKKQINTQTRQQLKKVAAAVKLFYIGYTPKFDIEPLFFLACSGFCSSPNLFGYGKSHFGIYEK